MHLLTIMKPNLEEAGTNRISELEELAVYLWENYIEYDMFKGH